VTVNGHRRSWRHPMIKSSDQLTTGERAADLLRNGMGSWGFVLSALAFLAGWMIANGTDGFDPFPFILLNLILSCLAALQGAILLIAAKRADALARDLAEHDYKTNLEAAEIIKEIRQLTVDIHRATTGSK
jgi:uncharacterized membrane protein